MRAQHSPPLGSDIEILGQRRKISTMDPKWNPPPFLSNLGFWFNSLEKTLMLEKTVGKSGRGQQRMRWLDSTIDSIHMNLSKLCEQVEEAISQSSRWHAAVHGVAKSRTWLSNSTTTTSLKMSVITLLPPSPVQVTRVEEGMIIVLMNGSLRS